jgi:CheY-like chemotaxis protein
VIRVTDSGIGIGAEELPRLFELFFQVNRSLERSEGGLGIGLTLAQRLVDLHGGTIEARSAGPGQGSQFVVTLPVPQETTAVQQASAAAHPAAAPLRILVADDNADSAESLAVLLRLAGHEVRTAHDGEEAFALAESFRPDVALLDIGMPHTNGYDLARRLHAEPWGKDIVLIAETGWGQEDDRRRTREAGFEAHLVKPVDSARLMALLSSLRPGASREA